MQMSRVPWIWLLTSCALLGCTYGGTFDPLSNAGSGSPNLATDLGSAAGLPACSSTVGAPCKLVLDDLSFTEDPGCGYKGDTTLGMTWNNPSGMHDRVQFGVRDTSALQTCGSYEAKRCDMVLSSVPALFNTIAASQIKLTFAEQHNFTGAIVLNGGNVVGEGISTGSLLYGSTEILALTNHKTALGPITVSLPSAANRSLTFRISTNCWQVFSPNLPVYWYIEGMSAEMLP
jgi:hypothetical protein